MKATNQTRATSFVETGRQLFHARQVGSVALLIEHQHAGKNVDNNVQVRAISSQYWYYLHFCIFFFEHYFFNLYLKLHNKLRHL